MLAGSASALSRLVRWPCHGRLRIAMCVALVGMQRTLRSRFILLRGPRAVRALEWSADGEFAAFLGAVAHCGGRRDRVRIVPAGFLAARLLRLRHRLRQLPGVGRRASSAHDGVSPALPARSMRIPGAASRAPARAELIPSAPRFEVRHVAVKNHSIRPHPKVKLSGAFRVYSAHTEPGCSRDDVKRVTWFSSSAFSAATRARSICWCASTSTRW